MRNNYESSNGKLWNFPDCAVSMIHRRHHHITWKKYEDVSVRIPSRQMQIYHQPTAEKFSYTTLNNTSIDRIVPLLCMIDFLHVTDQYVLCLLTIYGKKAFRTIILIVCYTR